MSFTLICRACLNTGYDIKFLELDDSRLKLFQYCIGIKLESTQQWYQCLSCADLIMKYAEFKRKCLEADSCYNSMQIEVLEPDNEQKVHEQQLLLTIANDELVYDGDEMPVEECKVEVLVKKLEIDDSLLTERTKKAKVKKKPKPIKEFKCLYCYRKIDEFIELHKAECKIKKKFPVACGLCNFKDSKDTIAKAHVQHHFTENMLSCTLCTYIGRDFADMVAHSYVHLDEDGSFYNFFCPCCDKKFMKVNMLTFHFRSVHLNKIGGLCSYCNRTYTTYHRFRRHLRIHTIDGFVCDNCNRKFLTRKELITHLKEEAGVKPYICDVCGAAFKKSWYLTGHIKKVHTKHKSVTCNHCGRKYKSEYFLQKHLKSLTKEYNFQCDYCALTYTTKHQLKSHLAGHTQQKISCRFCKKQYAWKSHLVIHEKLHMGLNPFKCRECDQEFQRRRDLIRHRYIHDPMALQCPVCPNKKFYSRRKLMTHCKEVHKLVPDSVVANKWVAMSVEEDNK